MKTKTVALIVVVVLLLFGVAIGIMVANRHGSSPAPNLGGNHPESKPVTNPPSGGDLYYDQNGCLQSRSGKIHPEYCLPKTQ